MHVPDSITVGPTRSTIPRLHQDENRVPVRMEVPDRLRPGLSQPSHHSPIPLSIDSGGNGSMILLNDTDFFANGDSNPLSDSFIQQPSLPSTLHPKDIESTSDDDYTAINVKNGKSSNPIADS